ncbi:MAG: GTP 3',8-cyclase MoaA [Myxococcales bacterium]|nr:GTP 3',8-cyclase MoaA [Myxococcales bacterium]
MKVSLPVVESRSAVYEPLAPRPAGFAVDGVPPLVDRQGRRYTYLRLSVTDRCDLACVYCMPPGGEDDHAVRRELLSFEEAARLIRVFGACGVRRVRFTGGEPLVRKDVVELVRLVRDTTDVAERVMTTNATRLRHLAGPLRAAGLDGVNISLDSLEPARFRRLTRGGELADVLAGLRAALDVGLDVKLNTVLLRGDTDDEVERLVDFAWDAGVTPRFIELMPLGEGAKLPRSARVTAAEVLARLRHKLAPAATHQGAGASSAPRGPARYHAAADGSGRRVGFITPMSDEFCGSCNRVRVTARGDIRACLASRRALSLRDLMRGGASDLDLAWALHWSLTGKADGHFFVDGQVHEHEHVGMSLIGG